MNNIASWLPDVTIAGIELFSELECNYEARLIRFSVRNFDITILGFNITVKDVCFSINFSNLTNITVFIIDLLSAIIDKLGGLVLNVGEALVNAAKKILGKIFELFTDPASFFKSLFSSCGGGGGKATKKFQKKVKRYLGADKNNYDTLVALEMAENPDKFKNEDGK